jgi:hypothetical protein
MREISSVRVRAWELDEMRESHVECVRVGTNDIAVILIMFVLNTNQSIHDLWLFTINNKVNLLSFCSLYAMAVGFKKFPQEDDSF